MKKQFLLSCLLIFCLASNFLYAPDAADPFEELFKGIDFEKIARDLGLSDEMFETPKSALKDTSKQTDTSAPGLKKSKQETKEKTDKEKKEFIKKDQKTLFLESNVKPGPEKSSKEMPEELSREKKEAFKQVMNNIITLLKSIETSIDQSFPVLRDVFKYKSNIDIFVAATELMQKKRLYLNFFFLPLYDKLRGDIYNIKTDLQNLDEKIQAQIKKQPAQDIAKLAKEDSIKFQKIAPLTPTKKVLRGSKESNKQDADFDSATSSNDTEKNQDHATTQANTQISKEATLQRDITQLFEKKFIPITQELEKMLSSPAYKEALKKRIEERDKITKESERSRERSERGYSSSSPSYRPRRYSPDSDSYDSSYRRPSRSSWDSPSRSSWDSPSSYGSSADKPFGSDSVTSKDSSSGKSSSPGTTYGASPLTKKEIAAKKLAENLYKKIMTEFTRLTKAKKPLIQSELETLVSWINEKDGKLNAFTTDDDETDTKKAKPKTIVAKPKDYKQTCQAFLQELVKALGPDKDGNKQLTTASSSTITTLFTEIEKHGEVSKATIKQKLGERTNEFLTNHNFVPALRELKKTSLELQKNLDAEKTKLKASEKKLDALNKKVPVVANDVTKETAIRDTIKKDIEDHQKKYTETQKTSVDLQSKLKDFIGFSVYGGDTRPEHQANTLDKALEDTKIPDLAK